jgi:hypothetical protein
VHKKNQGLMQKRNPKINTMIKLSQQSSRISGIRRIWLKEETKSRKGYIKDTILQLSKIWSLQEPLSSVKEKEGNRRSNSCQRKVTLKESQAG